MYGWLQKNNETSLSKKEDFYNQLNMKAITDAVYTHIKRVCKGFERKYLGKYYDFYVQSNTLLPAVVFENFQDMCPKIFELNPVRFFCCTRISMVSSFNKKQSKTISIVLNWYWCVNSKYMKYYDKDKELLYLRYWDANNLYGWVIWQNLPLDRFKLVENKFNEDNDKRYFPDD